MHHLRSERKWSQLNFLRVSDGQKKQYSNMHFQSPRNITIFCRQKTTARIQKEWGTSSSDISNTMYSVGWKLHLRDDNWFFFALARLRLHMFACNKTLFMNSFLFTYAGVFLCIGFFFLVGNITVSLYTVKTRTDENEGDKTKSKQEKESENMPECKWFSLKNTLFSVPTRS